MKQVIACLVLVAPLIGSELQAQDAAKPELRTWTDATGQFKIPAKLVRVLQDRVVLRSNNGVIEVSLDKLSPTDIAYARSGFLFSYTPGKGFMSLDDLGKAFLNAIKKQDGAAIINMYIPSEIVQSASGFAEATDKQKQRSLEKWKKDINDKDGPRYSQGQRIAHFFNGEFQRRKAQQGFNLANAQYVDTTYATSLFVDENAEGDLFALNPAVLFQLPEYPGKLFFVEMADSVRIQGRWYIARFGNTYNPFGFCLAETQQDLPQKQRVISHVLELLVSARTSANIETVEVGLSSYCKSWNTSVERKGAAITFSHRDAKGKRTSLPIDNLPNGAYITSVSIKGKKGATSSGILDILAMLKEIPTVRRLSINNIPGDAAAVVDAIESLPYNLETISLMDIPSLSDSDAARVFLRHKLLQTVRLYSCPNIGSKTIKAILSENLLTNLGLWTLPKVTLDDLKSLDKTPDLYQLTFSGLRLSPIDIQRLLGKTTAQKIELQETTLTPADLRTLRVAPEMPWEWRNLIIGGPAFKGLSDEEVQALETEYNRNNPGAYQLFLSTF